jgi:hypothetical protein
MQFPDTILANGLLIVHFLWAIWMVAGVLLTVVGFWWVRFWRWTAFRTAHLVGLVITGSTPLWSGGICPLTVWEWRFRAGQMPGERESFIVYWIRELLFYDVDPLALSLVSSAAALFVVIMYAVRPPWKAKRAQSG